MSALPLARRTALFLALGLLAGRSAAPAEPTRVALVVEAAPGGAEVTPSGGTTRALHRFDWLPLGSRVVANDATVVLAFVNGKRWQAPPGALLTVGREGPGPGSSGLRELEPLPELPALVGVADGVRAGSRAGALRIRGGVGGLYPGGGATALAHATVLRFLPVLGATGYRVAIENREETVVYQVETRSTEVEVPDSVLEAGASYFWTVASKGVEPPHRGASCFRTLDRATASTRATLADAIARDGSPSAWGLLAACDRDLGLLFEARTGLAEARGRSPGDRYLEAAVKELEELLSEATGCPE